MPQKIRLWEISDNNIPSEIDLGLVKLEKDLEDLLVKDISILAPDLLVIGKQVETAYGKWIDILCIDNNGELVIVELKKDKTPREVVSQALEYAYWVKNLTYPEIQKITERYFQSSSIEEAFKTRFEEDLPESLNNSHRSIIVANEIDSQTEQIVQYLSDMEVPINAATFNYFQTDEGKSYFAQVYQIEPEIATKKGKSKRTSTTISMGEIYEHLRERECYTLYMELKNIALPVLKLSQGGRNMRLIPKDPDFNKAILMFDIFDSTDLRAIQFRFNAIRARQHYGLQVRDFREVLPPETDDLDPRDWKSATSEEKDDWIGYKGYFSNAEQLSPLVELLLSSGSS
ncbi:MAG: endonuclease NucS [Gammaproteobacteria bacterium]|nr:endonuclease NucS [Gammaproteobacteria bacterium]